MSETRSDRSPALLPAEGFQTMSVTVTGAAGALGRATVAAYLAAGARRVAALDRDTDALAHAFGGDDRVAAVACDLTDDAAAREGFARAAALAGPPDAVAAIAGGFAMGPAVHETEEDLWERMQALNVTTLRHTLTAVVPGMVERGRGAIVTVGAAGAVKGQAGMGAYIAAKSTVMRLTEAASAELRSKGVNVNAVLPSIIDTPANRQAMPNADPAKWVTPQDLAAVILFLTSPAARAIHGALVPVVGLS
ncbi:MAG: SDR family NAD(P)-dependent oxidoreductase [Azospirillaceae bacterium]